MFDLNHRHECFAVILIVTLRNKESTALGGKLKDVRSRGISVDIV